MHERHFKDLAITLAVIAFIVLGFRAHYLYKKVSEVPERSAYTEIGMSQSLLTQIEQINDSIIERKNFRFNVRRDPLKQDFVVQSRLDLLAEWEAMVRRMMRLTSIILDNDGNSVAIIAYEGNMNLVKENETIGGRRITSITPDRVYFSESGRTGYLQVEPVPPKPAELQGNR